MGRRLRGAARFSYARAVTLTVASWNLFHGRSRPATRADLVDAFADALAAQPWDVCGLQESPPWWTRELAAALGASAVSVRTSLTRGAFPAVQERVHRRDPERIGVHGAAANVLLVRPQAGEIVDHRSARLRRAPQRRSVHAVRLRRAGGEHWWVANVHTHNKPESAAAADAVRAMTAVDAWAGGEPAVLLGDLNLATPQGLARVHGWDHLHGHRVDHVLGRGIVAAGGAYATVAKLPDGPELADHRIVGLRLARR